MTKNIEMPVNLAASVVDHLKKGSASVLAACTEIATAVTAFEEGAWSEEEYRSFFDKLAENNIGKGSSIFIKTDSKGITTFDGRLKAGSLYQMMAVGRCPAFKTPEFIGENRTTSYGTLYRLTVLYNAIVEKSSGSAQKKQERAQKAVLELVRTHGVALTRKEVDEAVAAAQTERRSRAPVKPIVEEAPAEYSSGEVVLTDLLSREERYDVVVMTPPEEFLTEAGESSLGTLIDRAPYQDLRRAESQAVLIGSGRHMAGLKKLAEATGDLTFCYCVRAKPDASHIIDITKELLVFASSPLDGEATIGQGETPDQFVRRLVADGTNPSLRKLHLFADGPATGWDTCGVLSSTKEA
jgi:hypothetical protein